MDQVSVAGIYLYVKALGNLAEQGAIVKIISRHWSVVDCCTSMWLSLFVSRFDPLFLYQIHVASIGTGTATNGDLLSSSSASSPAQQNFLPFDLSQLGSSSCLPAASAEALQRHAVMATAAAAKRRPKSAAALQLQQRQQPLYPAFDSAPLEPIKYGFESQKPSAPLVPGAYNSQVPFTPILH